MLNLGFGHMVRQQSPESRHRQGICGDNDASKVDVAAKELQDVKYGNNLPI